MRVTMLFEDEERNAMERAIHADEMAEFIVDAFVTLNNEISETVDVDIVKGMRAAEKLLRDLLDEYPSVKGLEWIST
jgi:hypothetical protein